MDKTRVTLGPMRTLLVSLGFAMLLGCGGSSAPAPNSPMTKEEKAEAPPAPTKNYFENARGCFTMREIKSGETFEMGGDECGERTLPASTFKIPNAIIALETGVLKDEKTFLKWDGQKRWNPDWDRDHALPTSMWYSVVWFYQDIARQVGADRYRKYLADFHYGNGDPSGEITMFWLKEGHLRISPREQVAFLTELYTGKLPVSERSVEIVKKILELRGEAKEHVRERLPFVDRIPENVVLSGKTGSAFPDEKPHGPKDVVGWFVGSVEKEGRRWVFATRIRSADEEKIGPVAGKIAYEILHDRGML